MIELEKNQCFNRDDGWKMGRSRWNSFKRKTQRRHTNNRQGKSKAGCKKSQSQVKITSYRKARKNAASDCNRMTRMMEILRQEMGLGMSF